MRKFLLSAFALLTIAGCCSKQIPKPVYSPSKVNTYEEYFCANQAMKEIYSHKPVNDNLKTYGYYSRKKSYNLLMKLKDDPNFSKYILIYENPVLDDSIRKIYKELRFKKKPRTFFISIIPKYHHFNFDESDITKLKREFVYQIKENSFFSGPKPSIDYDVPNFHKKDIEQKIKRFDFYEQIKNNFTYESNDFFIENFPYKTVMKKYLNWSLKTVKEVKTKHGFKRVSNNKKLNRWSPKIIFSKDLITYGQFEFRIPYIREKFNLMLHYHLNRNFKGIKRYFTSLKNK